MEVLPQYAYSLPPELIAKAPAKPRDAARLFVYDTTTDEVVCTTFKELGCYLPPVTFVYNDTKVVPARLRGETAEQQPIELLMLMDSGVEAGTSVRALVNRSVGIGDVLTVAGHTFTVRDTREKWMVLECSFSATELLHLLETAGTTPIPPYIKDTPLTETALRTEYQSIFARTEASVAAPTAALHFTKSLVQELVAAGSEFLPVTLHVGLGTFAPVVSEQLVEKRLHRERYEVTAEVAKRLKVAKEQYRPIVAIGTTVVRTLESAKSAIRMGQAATGATDLFIMPPHTFTFPDMLITNFHVPRSSLMCMVDAFLKHKQAKRELIDLYEIAIREQFRFYSFGDGMLIK